MLEAGDGCEAAGVGVGCAGRGWDIGGGWCCSAGAICRGGAVAAGATLAGGGAGRGVFCVMGVHTGNAGTGAALIDGGGGAALVGVGC